MTTAKIFTEVEMIVNNAVKKWNEFQTAIVNMYRAEIMLVFLHISSIITN